MNEHPIIFSAAMVQAILASDKTMTRRVINPQPECHGKSLAEPCKGAGLYHVNLNGCLCCAGCLKKVEYSIEGHDTIRVIKCPYGVIGDRLWVRETWKFNDFETDPDYPAFCKDAKPKYIYAEDSKFYGGHYEEMKPWKSPLFMPKEASRITLEITNIDVQRVQDITPADARREGFVDVEAFRDGWDKIHKNCPERLWDESPWVWVIEFRRIPNEAMQ